MTRHVHQVDLCLGGGKKLLRYTSIYHLQLSWATNKTSRLMTPVASNQGTRLQVREH